MPEVMEETDVYTVSERAELAFGTIAETAPPATCGKETRPIRALLVDDSAIMRMMLKSLLGQVKISSVEQAANGIDALKQLDNDDFDVILLDLHMPEMDGIGFLTERTRHPESAEVPVIVVSSDTDNNQVQEALAAGASAYVAKPFRIDALEKALSKALPQWKERV